MKINFPPEVVERIENSAGVIFTLNGQNYRIEPFDYWDTIGYYDKPWWKKLKDELRRRLNKIGG